MATELEKFAYAYSSRYDDRQREEDQGSSVGNALGTAAKVVGGVAAGTALLGGATAYGGYKLTKGALRMGGKALVHAADAAYTHRDSIKSGLSYAGDKISQGASYAGDKIGQGARIINDKINNRGQMPRQRVYGIGHKKVLGTLGTVK